jgi:ammonium transporter, Amt family
LLHPYKGWSRPLLLRFGRVVPNGDPEASRPERSRHNRTAAASVEYWAAPIIGLVAGVLVVYAVLSIDKLVDDPVGALSAHGLAGIWGTLAVGLFASPRLVAEGAGSGLWYAIFGDQSFSSAFGQLGVQALAVAFTFVVVFAISIATFALIKATIGLRVPAEEEDAGLDISSHGMYGYPEMFIPQPEYSTGLPTGGGLPRAAGSPGTAAVSPALSTDLEEGA